MHRDELRELEVLLADGPRSRSGEAVPNATVLLHHVARSRGRVDVQHDPGRGAQGNPADGLRSNRCDQGREPGENERACLKGLPPVDACELQAQRAQGVEHSPLRSWVPQRPRIRTHVLKDVRSWPLTINHVLLRYPGRDLTEREKLIS